MPAQSRTKTLCLRCRRDQMVSPKTRAQTAAALAHPWSATRNNSGAEHRSITSATLHFASRLRPPTTLQCPILLVTFLDSGRVVGNSEPNGQNPGEVPSSRVKVLRIRTALAILAFAVSGFCLMETVIGIVIGYEAYMRGAIRGVPFHAYARTTMICMVVTGVLC
jgi:hypothetical protein